MFFDILIILYKSRHFIPPGRLMFLDLIVYEMITALIILALSAFFFVNDTFMDYVKVGLPLQIIMGVVMIFLLPLLFPF